MKPILSMLAAALALAAALPAASPNKTTMRSQWAAQDINGTITMVDPAKRLVVVQTASGVPFDLDVTSQTQIRNGDQRLSLTNLNQDMNRNVSVRLIPERRGDVASWIRLGS